MLSRRHVSVLSISLFSLLLLTQFQNCAPAKAPSSSAASGDPNARLIEDFNKVQIQFVAPEVQLHDEAAAADVTGLCNREHNGAKLKWTIWASAGTPLMTGESICQSGQFDLRMAALEQMVCGVGHQLVVESDWGDSAYTKILRRCQPLASEPLVEMSTAQITGTTCAMEYVPADDGVSPCSTACYRQGLLVSQAYVDRAQCSGLAARLAGP